MQIVGQLELQCNVSLWSDELFNVDVGDVGPHWTTQTNKNYNLIMERYGGSAQLYQGDSHVSAGWLTDDRSRLKDTLCSHFPSSKIVNLGRFNFQLEPITISREVFLAITEPGVTEPATTSH